MADKKRILVVDDEPQITRVLRTASPAAATKSAPPTTVTAAFDQRESGSRTW